MLMFAWEGQSSTVRRLRRDVKFEINLFQSTKSTKILYIATKLRQIWIVQKRFISNTCLF